MPPVGDSRDLEEQRAWGLGPPVRGDFTRQTVQLIAWVGIPGTAILVLVWWWLPSTPGYFGVWELAPLFTVWPAIFLGWAWLLIALGNATTVQVGTKGVALTARKFFGGTERRVAWIPWGDVRLGLPGRGYKFTRTLGISVRGSPAMSWMIDYPQVHAILDHPNSKVIFHSMPDWLAQRLNISASRLDAGTDKGYVVVP